MWLMYIPIFWFLSCLVADSFLQGSVIFVLTWTKIDTDVVDFELLVYLIFKVRVLRFIYYKRLTILFD